MRANPINVESIPAQAVRAPTAAGSFYPAEPGKLRHLMQASLAQAQPKPVAKKWVAAISPHAGYIYSGGVAAHVYKLLASTPLKTIAVLAPSHFEYFPFVSVFTGAAYRTPLGDLAVARSLANQLIAGHELLVSAWNGHHDSGLRCEHALEVQLPFLQVTLPAAVDVLPIVMGDNSWEMCEVLGQALARLALETPLFLLVSSDLSHYHPHDEAVQIDRHFIELLLEGDARKLHSALTSRACEACGSGPIVAATIAAKQLGADAIETLCYRTSGEVSGDFSRVVGYLAAAYCCSH